jgi:hypothetical protein
MKTLLFIILASFFASCEKLNPVEPQIAYQLEVTQHQVLTSEQSSISYKASIVEGVLPSVYLWVNDSHVVYPAKRHITKQFEYGTIVYPTNIPPIPVLYAFWGNNFRFIDLGSR